jgi:hypothetical protein
VARLGVPNLHFEVGSAYELPYRVAWWALLMTMPIPFCGNPGPRSSWRLWR